MEQPSRRAILRAAVVVAASVAAPAALVSPAAAAPRRFVRTQLRRRVFRPHVGTPFRLSAGDRAYRAVLTAVVDDPTRPAETRFSLRFAMAGGARPADGVYRVTHPSLRPFALYVGAIGQRDDGAYEAVVNS